MSKYEARVEHTRAPTLKSRAQLSGRQVNHLHFSFSSAKLQSCTFRKLKSMVRNKSRLFIRAFFRGPRVNDLRQVRASPTVIQASFKCTHADLVKMHMRYVLSRTLPAKAAPTLVLRPAQAVS